MRLNTIRPEKLTGPTPADISALNRWIALLRAKLKVFEQIASAAKPSPPVPVPAEFLIGLFGTPFVGNQISVPVPVHTAFQFVEAKAYLDTAPCGGNVVLQITRNGIAYGNPITILSGATVSAPMAITLPNLGKDDILNVNVTTTAGCANNLTVKIQGLVNV